MRNIYVTGRGLVTPLGYGLSVNEAALREGKSGVTYRPDWKDAGLESHIGGVVDKRFDCPLFTKKNLRYMTENARMAVAAGFQAMEEAGFTLETLHGKPYAVVLGCGGGSYLRVYEGASALRDSGRSKRVSPFIVPQTMPSSAVANLSLALGLKGESFDISSACASSAHAIAIACRLIDSGDYDVVFTGGCEELNWLHALGFDAMRAISRRYNECPERASRPFDRDRDGFVIAEGSGVLVLESERSVRERGVRPIVRVSGLGANSNATDMVQPDAESSANVMEQAIRHAGLTPRDIQYVNTHGTATPMGDPVEMEALKQVFHAQGAAPAINSTKSMTGHMIGATGAVELIFTTQMMEKRFLSPSLNLDNPEPEFAWADLLRETRENVEIRHALSNSFGFGGTNSCLVVSQVD